MKDLYMKYFNENFLKILMTFFQDDTVLFENTIKDIVPWLDSIVDFANKNEK